MSTPKNHKPGSLSIGPLSPIKGTGKHYTPQRIAFTTPDRVTNASVTEPLKDYAGLLARTEMRPGCQTARALPSRGTGC